MYGILVAALKFFIGWKVDLDVEGQEYIPRKGPLLVVFNHNDFLDVLAIIFSLPRKMVAFVAYGYRYNPLVILFKLAGSVILIKRGLSDKEAMKKGLSVLDQRKILVVAPEGTRGSIHTLGVGKFGPAYLAGRTDSRILPVGIQGTYGGFNRLISGLFKKDRIKIIVKIGKPFYLSMIQDLETNNLRREGVKDKWQAITNDQIMPQIACLLPEEMRGQYLCTET